MAVRQLTSIQEFTRLLAVKTLPYHEPYISTPGPAPGNMDSFPDLPAVPMSTLPDPPGSSSAGGEDVDFDDLSRRFEELKRKK